jgi:uncharacterized protein
MARAVGPTLERPAGWRGVIVLALVAAAVAAAVRLADPGRVGGLENFIVVVSSLLIEAFPFILLGALVSAAIEVFVPARAFERIAGLPRSLQVPASALAGMALPICECGSVPVARRLATKGLSAQAAVTFMLAAPILNPVVLASTAMAYRGRDIMWPMVLGRAGLGLVAAIAVGWAVAGWQKDLVRPVPQGERSDLDRGEPRWRRFFGHLSGDVLFMGRYLVIGAMAAAAIQTFVPQTLLAGVAARPILGIAAMMVLAVALSLCSESDAFVAASFVQFGAGAQLAFLVVGPMFDTKLAFLYLGTFRRGFVTIVATVVGAVALVGALWFEVVVG